MPPPCAFKLCYIYVSTYFIVLVSQQNISERLIELLWLSLHAVLRFKSLVVPSPHGGIAYSCKCEDITSFETSLCDDILRIVDAVFVQWILMIKLR